jgi:MinD superfamily P-loop ATPase
VDSCPNDVLELVDGCPFASQPDRCEGCEVCVALCEQEAIEIEEH